MPSIADDLRLTPQAKTVLAHLRRHGDITPAKADAVYGITRLASCIHEIRKVGYDVKTENRKDDVGHKYGQYTLELEYDLL
jgi:glycyl-tRNA synthetase alpha subunit